MCYLIRIILSHQNLLLKIKFLLKLKKSLWKKASVCRKRLHFVAVC